MKVLSVTTVTILGLSAVLPPTCNQPIWNVSSPPLRRGCAKMTSTSGCARLHRN